MDLKGITWVGNICQKFESMYLEVEDIVCQEAKFVESRVQTVGASVKRFYEEVVQDMLPPSLDPSEWRNSQLHCEQKANDETCKTSEETVEENLMKEKSSHDESEVPLERDSSQASFSTETDDVDHLQQQSMTPDTEVILDLSLEENNAPMSSLDAEDGTVEDKDSAISVSKITTSLGTQSSISSSILDKVHLNSIDSEDSGIGLNVSLKQNSDIEKSNMLIIGIEEDLVSLPSEASHLLVDRLSHEDDEKVNDAVTKMPPHVSVITLCKSTTESNTCDNAFSFTDADINRSLSASALLLQAVSSQNAITLTSSSNSLPADVNGRLDDDHVELIQHNDGVESCIQNSEQFANVNLGESCIVVDSRKIVHVSPKSHNNRSYKKKIRDAFASRLRSTKQREYEQLVILYGDVDAEINLKGAGTCIPCTLTNDFGSIHDSYESDWELL